MLYYVFPSSGGNDRYKCMTLALFF